MALDRRSRDAWRGGSASTGHAGRPAIPARQGKSGVGRWLLAALLVAAIAGAIAGIFIFTGKPPDPVLLAIPITQYAHPDWPANPFAEADARGFRDRFGGDSAQAFQVQEKARILRELNQLADDSRDKNKGRPIVVYLSALAVATDAGVALIPGDARPGDPSGWLTLTEVLQPFRRTDSSRLLILDLRPCVGLRTSLPAEDVNEALDAQLSRLEQEGDLPFFVFSAATPAAGPVSLRALRHTAFGLALAHAAGGAADGWSSTGRTDGRVSVRELADAVREFTHLASTKAGGSPQAPKLYGRGEDFRLLPVPSTGPSPLPILPEAEPLPPWLTEAWQLQDKIQKEGLHRRAPRVAWYLCTHAERAERQYLCGLDPVSVQDKLRPVLADVPGLQASAAPLVPPRLSIARAMLDPAARAKLPEVEAALRPVLERIRNPEGVKPDEFPAAMQAVWAKPPDAAPYDVVAAVIFSTAQQLETPSPAQLRHLVTLARGFKPAPAHPELAMLDLIASLPADMTRRWPTGTIARLLRVTRTAEEATSAAGRSGAWIVGRIDMEGSTPGKATGLLAQIDAKRREAVAVLTDPEIGDDDWRTASEKLDGLAREYQSIADCVAGLEAARLEYEETRAVLADIATRFPQELVADAELMQKTWTALVEDTIRLRDALRTPSEPGLPDLDALSRAADTIRTNRRKLTAMAAVSAEAGAPRLDRALQWPRWPVATRLDLLNRLTAADRDAATAVLTNWPRQPSGVELPKPPSSAPALTAASVRQLRRMTDLLLLVELPDARDLDRDVRKLGASPSAADLAAVGKRVRAAWVEGVPAALRAGDVSRRVAIAWTVHPYDLDVAPRPGLDFNPNPEAGEERTRQLAFHRWLGEYRYQTDARSLRRENREDIPKAVRDYAAALEDTGRKYQDWKP